jgi:hypothetical protein
VNAQLHVAGDTNTRRHVLGEASFDSIRKQVDESKRNTVQKTYNSESEITASIHVLKKKIFQETHASDRVRVYQFFEQPNPTPPCSRSRTSESPSQMRPNLRGLWSSARSAGCLATRS